MSMFDSTNWGSGDPSPGYSTPDLVGTAQQIGADTSYDAPATSGGSYAGQDSSSGDSASSPWTGFFQNTLQTALGYAITKDAVRSGLTGQPAGNPAGNAQAAVQPKAAGMSPVLLLLLGGAVIFVAVKLAK